MDRELYLFVRTLARYFRSRGRWLLGLLGASGQDRVRIEFHGLYHYFEGGGRYRRFSDLYKVLRTRYGGKVSIYGYTVELHGNYIVVPRDLIRYVLEELN